MDEIFWFILLMVLICSASDIAKKALEVAAKRGPSTDRTEAELAALRQEIAGLKTWANDLILSFDSTLHDQNARLQSLERRALGENGASTRLGVGPAEAQRDAAPIEARMGG